MSPDGGGHTAFEDYYDLLGVERSADRAEIMAAYRELVGRYHPDVADRRAEASLDDETTAELFTHLTRAREILSNEAHRAEYDRLGHERYLLEHTDGTTLTPGDGGDRIESDRERVRGEGGKRGDPTWYRAASAPGPSAEPVVDDGTRGSVVEGDPETTIDDLIDRDPVETAWRWFRWCWLGRAVVALGSLVAVLVAGLGPRSGLAVVSGATAVSVLLTGGYAHVRLPRATDPRTPPPSASIGLLRPERIGRCRRWATAALALAAVLTVTAGVSAPSASDALRTVLAGGPLGTPWVRAGTLGAPKLLEPLNAALTVAFVGSLLVGTAAAGCALSGESWLAGHGGHRRGYPVVADLLTVAGAVAVAGLAVPGPLLGVTLPVPASLAGAVGAAGGTPTGTTLGLLGTVALLLWARHSAAVSTSATAS